MRLIHAVRELRVERDEDIRTIALHTAAERTAMFVREADEAVCLDDGRRRRQPVPRPRLRSSGRCVAARADAAWVGWGFVAERPEFAELCERLGITFVGPTRRGDAQARRQDRRQAASPRRPTCRWRRGAAARSRRSRTPRRHAEAIGYPLMIKATAGGGGRGIRRVDERRRAARRRSRAPASEGAQGVRRPDRVHGARRHRRPPRRGPADRRQPRHGVGRRRARLQHAAPQPEGDRGVALHRAHARSRTASCARRPCAWRRRAGYANAGTVEFLYQPERAAASRSSRSTPACRSSTRSPS